MDSDANSGRIVVVAGFFTDVLKGVTNSLPGISTAQDAQKKPPQTDVEQRGLIKAIEDARKSAAEAAVAAHKAATDAELAATQPSTDTASVAKRSASDASIAAQKTSTSIKALEKGADTFKVK
jgi:uncharacterized membrane protein